MLLILHFIKPWNQVGVLHLTRVPIVVTVWSDPLHHEHLDIAPWASKIFMTKGHGALVE
jgi:hypothetical protein